MSDVPQTTTVTLFPYTTLFRSLSLVDWLACRGDLSVEDNRLPDLIDGDRPELEGWQLDSSDASPCSPDGVGDRKSTRLNSSHVAISYAVFCLKKKNL